MTPFRYQNYLTVGRFLLFFRQRERLRCRSQLVRPDFGEGRVPPHADQSSVPTSKPIAPVGVVGASKVRLGGRVVKRLDSSFLPESRSAAGRPGVEARHEAVAARERRFALDQR
jgi:hypothetical protein